MHFKIKHPFKLKVNSIKIGFEKGVRVVIKGYKSLISLGNNIYLMRYGNIEVYDGGLIEIGNNVSINKNFSIVSRNKIRIGNNVSIGSNSTILPIKICSNVVIGAGSVVTKNILKPGFYVGNPAKFLKKISKKC